MYNSPATVLHVGPFDGGSVVCEAGSGVGPRAVGVGEATSMARGIWSKHATVAVSARDIGPIVAVPCVNACGAVAEPDA